MDRKALWIIIIQMCIFTFFRQPETSLFSTVSFEHSSSLLSPLQPKKNIFFSFSSSISLSRLCRCASLSLSMFMSLSLCPAVSLQWTNSPGEHTSQSAHSAFTEVVSESVIPHLFCLLCATWSEEFHYLSMLVCVCVYLSNSLPHTFADVFPDANITTPITLERATHKSAL